MIATFKGNPDLSLFVALSHLGTLAHILGKSFETIFKHYPHMDAGKDNLTCLHQKLEQMVCQLLRLAL
jgi:hypothetical protein